MALPKLETPTYTLTIPSTDEKIKYRPFLVKEQKRMMIAQEAEDEQQIIDAMKQLIKYHPDYQMKPVISSLKDLGKVKELQKILDVPNDKVW